MCRYLSFFLLVLLSGCGGDRSDDTAGDSTDDSLAGVYAGVFPCDGCPGIQATLWLRPDGRFFFGQQYAASEDRAAVDAYSLGRWASSADTGSVELMGEGPRRKFSRPDRDTLIMQTVSHLEHRLTRDANAAEFSATIGMAGMMRLRADGASFTECLTGLVAPVTKSGDFARLQHQFRSAVRRGEPALVELEGRFTWSRDGGVNSLTIERLLSIRTGESC